MTYEELVQSVKDIYANADAGNVKEHVAIQCNIEGEAEGALYIEFSEGNIDVQPYEYYDRDAILTLSAANLLEIAAGKKDLLEAYHANDVSVWGDLDKVVEMKKVILPKKKKEVEPEQVAEKATEEKATEKESSEEKAATEESEKKEECVQLEMHFEEPAETKAEEKVEAKTEEKPEEKKEEKVGGRRKRAARKAAMRKASHNKK